MSFKKLTPLFEGSGLGCRRTLIRWLKDPAVVEVLRPKQFTPRGAVFVKAEDWEKFISQFGERSFSANRPSW
jgi:hypothetical protein